METVERIRQIAAESFPGCDPRLEWDEDLQKVVGVIIWDGFGKLDHASRQGKLWKVLKDALGPDMQQVSLLLTYTPRDYNTMMAA